MEKLKLHTPDLVASNIQKLSELFPNCVTESRDEHGKLTRAVDFDQLRQEFAGHVVDGPRERYHLDWPGKREAMLAANAPIAKTLRPCRGDSVDFDTTRNLFIEGDNLDALKLLQETYLGKVKLIYIDPPYNTGNDFVYSDDFAEDPNRYLQRSNQSDDSGGRLVANASTDGRFHSVWLSMLYARLRLTRTLLSDDGVVLISIDSHENASLRRMCDEVFGGANFLGEISILSNPRGRQSEQIATTHESLIAFSRNQDAVTLLGEPLDDVAIAEYKHSDDKGRKYRLLGLRHRGNASRRIDRPNMYFPIYVNGATRRVSLERSATFDTEVVPRKSTGEDGRWEWGRDTVAERLSAIEAQQVGAEKRWDIFRRDHIIVDNGSTYRKKWKSIWYESSINYQNGKTELKALFGEKILFDYPKPLALLKKIVSGVAAGADIVLDLFAGSATTAHAVMALNQEDQGSRRVIAIQFPEACATESEAAMVGFRSIAEIAKERIRRAGEAVKLSAGLHGHSLDVGFRVLKIDTSNMKDVFYTPDESKQGDLLKQIDNIREDRTPEDLLFQVLVDWGVDLALPIAQENIDGKTVFFVDGNALAACFDPDVTDDLVKEIAKRKPLRAVFRDSSYSSDSVKINVEQIFKLLAPSTEIRSL